MPEVPPNVMSMRYLINSASTSQLSYLRRLIWMWQAGEHNKIGPQLARSQT